MKKWTRWEDWVAIAAGLAVALSTMFVAPMGASVAIMLTLGILLVASGVVNLAFPGLVAMEYVQGALGLLLIVSPWFGGYADADDSSVRVDVVDLRGDRRRRRCARRQAEHARTPRRDHALTVPIRGRQVPLPSSYDRAEFSMTETSGARVRILDAAELLFAQRGFDATPTSSIAKLAAVPKGLLFYYFPTKSDLLCALVAERLDPGPIDASALIEPCDPARALLNLAGRLSELQEDSAVLRVIIWREQRTHPEVTGTPARAPRSGAGRRGARPPRERAQTHRRPHPPRGRRRLGRDPDDPAAGRSQG